MPKLNEPATAPCRYIVIALDETEYWLLDRLPGPKPDRIVTTYLCSPDIGVHLCEVTPSLALLPVETHPLWDDEPEDDAARERVQEEVADEARRNEEPVSYMHRSRILRLCPGLEEFLMRTEGGVAADAPERRYRPGCRWVYVDSVPPGEDPDVTEEDIYEYVRYNSVL